MPTAEAKGRAHENCASRASLPSAGVHHARAAGFLEAALSCETGAFRAETPRTAWCVKYGTHLASRLQQREQLSQPESVGVQPFGYGSTLGWI